MDGIPAAAQPTGLSMRARWSVSRSCEVISTAMSAPSASDQLPWPLK
jgi:hypothetical protein